MNFSTQQTKLIQHARSPRMGLVACGAIRSGKTFATGISFASWVLTEAGPRYDHALIGQTVDAAMRNIGFDLVEILRSFGCPAYIDRTYGTRIVIPNRQREVSLWVWGGFDARARKRLQGATLKGLIVDEVALIPEDLFMMAWGRLSPEGSKWWSTANPETPSHWFKKKVIDQKERFDCELLNFKLDDNPSLTQETKDRYANAYTGHFKKRYIEGEWVGASGLIYPIYYEAPEIDAEFILHYAFSLDYGSAGVFAALCFAEHENGTQALGELYYDARERAPQTSDQLIEMFTEWRSKWVEPDFKPTVFVDPGTPVEIKRRLRRTNHIVRNGSNSVIDGIITTGARLESKNLTIANCPMLKEELQGYQWDPKAIERGEEAPLKQNDHAVDALRYYAHTTGRHIRRI